MQACEWLQAVVTLPFADVKQLAAAAAETAEDEAEEITPEEAVRCRFRALIDYLMIRRCLR